MMNSGRSMLARALPAAMLLASCASSSGATDERVSEDGSTVPVAEVVFDVDSTDEEWDLVAIGDSFLGWTTVAEQYAGLLEDDLGVEIAVEKIVNSTSNRLECLRNDTASQDLLDDAEIVVVEPQPGPRASAAFDPYLAGDCGGDDGLACFHTAQADFELYVGELFDELIALQGISAAAAAERWIGSVDVSLAFSGPDYTEAVPDGYLEIDETHLTDEGSRVVAELLHGLSTT